MRIAHVVQIPCPDRQTHTTDRFASSGEGLWDQTLIHVYQVCQCAATPVVISASLRRRPARIPTLTLTPLACRSFSLEIAQEPTYRWVAGRLLSLASSLIAQSSRYRRLHSDVRANLTARVNRRVMATKYRVVDPYQSMEHQP